MSATPIQLSGPMAEFKEAARELARVRMALKPDQRATYWRQAINALVVLYEDIVGEYEKESSFCNLINQVIDEESCRLQR